MTAIWNSFILDPMVNALILLYSFVGNNFIVALAIFTLAIRLAMLPLTLRQQRSQMRMQTMQPQIQAIQKKYKDNPQRMQEEFTKIGYNPADTLMGCLPLLLQFPIFIGLYRAIFVLLGSAPASVFDLTQKIYPSVSELLNVTELLPIANKFLWLNMAQPDPSFILPILVGGTMYLSQKLMMPANPPAADANNPMANMTQTMTYTMPLMFGFFSLSFPAGLSIYFVLSNLVSLGQGVIIRRSRENLEATMPKPANVVEAVDETKQISERSSAKDNGSTKSSASKNGSKKARKQQYSKRKKRSAKR